MSDKIKVSIVVPVYNVAPFLKQSLDSLCNQTLKEIEIICVDDGSTDGSLDMLYEYEKKYTNLTVLINKQEGPGAAHPRNMGIKYATGEYLLVLDPDDYFDLRLSEKVYYKADETDADVVIYAENWFNNQTGEFAKVNTSLNFSLIPKQNVFSPYDISETLFQLTYGGACNKLYRLKFIKNNNIKYQAIDGIDDTFLVIVH